MCVCVRDRDTQMHRNRGTQREREGAGRIHMKTECQRRPWCGKACRCITCLAILNPIGISRQRAIEEEERGEQRVGRVG